ncbi:MAG: DUF2892 domain-containing protein [Propionibacteriaceae bacterium]|nr:DUF2892 domain-containing protein [Propionibacteriaceae bacterium]
MKINESNIDRILRVVGGVALAVLGFGVVGGVGGSIVGGLGLVLVATGAIGFCPLYALFGISTCRVPKAG